VEVGLPKELHTDNLCERAEVSLMMRRRAMYRVV
jgi:hypothetical protein